MIQAGGQQCNVVVTNNDTSPVAADVRKPEQVEQAVAKAIEKFGRIDYLINGAAGNFLAPFENLSYNAFRTVIEIDLLGTFNLTKATLEHLKASKGAIINVSATLHYKGMPFVQHAGAAKAAIDVGPRRRRGIVNQDEWIMMIINHPVIDHRH